MKCSFCKVKEAKHNPKSTWNIDGKICSECYEYKYVNDSNSMINKPFFRKILKLAKNKGFVILIASLLGLSVLMRIIVQN